MLNLRALRNSCSYPETIPIQSALYALIQSFLIQSMHSVVVLYLELALLS